ncbi:hypothetical protein EDD37DRAFT_116904 [Exophiala viscosa]|uniref:uncharacterized protein n=1 Tax=Exophiala viscosa TaxID=2486360 RepID=UPI00219411C6|nr:hypothetical protein EDD37DRAFT_116904 [Exophiala viscosa]
MPLLRACSTVRPRLMTCSTILPSGPTTIPRCPTMDDMAFKLSWLSSWKIQHESSLPDIDFKKLIGHCSVYQEVAKYMAEPDDILLPNTNVEYDIEEGRIPGTGAPDHSFEDFLTAPSQSRPNEQEDQSPKDRNLKVFEQQVLDEDSDEEGEEDDDDDDFFLDDGSDVGDDDDDTCSFSSIEDTYPGTTYLTLRSETTLLTSTILRVNYAAVLSLWKGDGASSPRKSVRKKSKNSFNL